MPRLLELAQFIEELKAADEVTKLHFNRSELNGEIPNDIVLFRNLQALYLNNNELTGTLPEQLSILTKLQYFHVSSNQLSGNIPSAYSSLIHLKSLYMNNNIITGEIPVELSTLTNLELLFLNNNNLTGNIPNEFSCLTNLQSLWLNKNQLTGNIPSSISTLSNLEQLRLNHNSFYGSIPEEISNLINIQGLYLNDNQLTGNIPKELSFCVHLRELSLFNNSLSGTIPTDFSSLTNLQFLRLNNNQITGKIPQQISELRQLCYLKLQNNELFGDIPPELFRLSNLEMMDISNNEIQGSIPYELTMLTNLDTLKLNNNQLSGGISDEFQQAFQDIEVDISNNYFNTLDNIPEEWNTENAFQTLKQYDIEYRPNPINTNPHTEFIFEFGKLIHFQGILEDTIPVTAKVTNINAWKTLVPDECKGVEILICNDDNEESDEYIVTANVTLDILRILSNSDFIKSIKLSQIVEYCSLDKIKKDIGIEKNEFDSYCGENVVVGIIDGGIDFKHSNFRNEDGTTRFEYIWDQTISKSKYGEEGPNSKGVIFTDKEINQILLDNTIQDKYMELGHKPNKNSHGTHVCDIAGGNGKALGIASKSTLFFVNIEVSDAIFQSIRKQEIIMNQNNENETNFIHTNQLIEAAKYIFDKTIDRPCVINVSLGGQEGPHDGTNHIEQAFDALIKEKPNRAIVISAGNDRGNHIHISGLLNENESKEIIWQSNSNNNNGHSQVEIWYSGKDTFEITISDDNGNILVHNIKLGESGKLLVDNNMVGYVYHETDKDNNDNCIFIFFKPSSKLQKRFHIKLTGKHIISGEFHGWTSSYQDCSSKFLNDTKDSELYTLNSIATGNHTISVGSYSISHNHNISHFSSCGPTRDKRNKPDLCAPGQDVWAAGALSNNSTTKMSGTSQAAPIVSGIIARIFEVAHCNGIDLLIFDTKDILQKHCRNDKQENNEAWNPSYGYGLVNNIPNDIFSQF